MGSIEDSGRVVHNMLDRAVQEDPEALFASFFLGDNPDEIAIDLTRGELWQRANRFAAALQEAGVEKGQHVGLMLGNEPEFLSVYFGCFIAGAIFVPINMAYKGDILDHMLGQTQPRVICVDENVAARITSSVANTIEDPCQIVTMGDGEVPDEVRSGSVTFEDFTAGAQDPRFVDVKPWDPAAVQYTSGTTGPSKGVICCHNMLWSWAEQTDFALAYTEDDVSFTSLPLFHANAIVITLLPALLKKARVVFAPRFSVSAYWQQIDVSGATVTSLLGSMGALLWRQDPQPLERKHNLRLGLVIPSPLEYYDEFQERFQMEITELYGLTDSSIPLAVPHGESRPGSCGVPTPHWECDVFNEHDEPVQPGKIGELVCRPKLPYVAMTGYLEAPEATVRAWRNLWFHTGDYVRRDEEGWYYFVDRKKDAIRRRGENVSSFEVEQVLLSHDAVLDCAVYAVPSEFMEDEIMAAVVLRSGAEVHASELVEYCDPRMPYFALPRYIRFVEELPRTETQKVQKAALRDEGVTEDTWDGGEMGRREREKRDGGKSERLH